MKQQLIVYLTVFIFLYSCSKNDGHNMTPTKPINPDPEMKNKVLYILNSVDSSDYHIYVGTDTGGIDKSKSSDNKIYWKLSIKEKILDSLNDSLIVEDSTIIGYKNGKVRGEYYFKKNIDSLFWGDLKNGWNTNYFVLAGTIKDKIITISYPSYFLQKDQGALYSPFSIIKWGYVQEKALFNNDYYYKNTSQMIHKSDIASWINLKVSYEIKELK